MDSGAYLVAFCETLRHSLAPRAEGHIALFRSGQSCMHIKEGVLEVYESSFGRVGHRLGRGAWMRDGGFVPGEGIAMNQGMSRGAALDLPQACKITPLEVAISVLELPQCGIRRPGMKYIAH